MRLVSLSIFAVLIGSVGRAEATFEVGLLTDSKCGSSHKDVTEAQEPQCVRKCVKAGAQYVLKTIDATYQIGNQDFKDLDSYAGKLVILQGTRQGNSFVVSAVSSAPNIGSH